MYAGFTTSPTRYTGFPMVQDFQTTKSDSLLMLSGVYDFLELQKYDGDG